MGIATSVSPKWLIFLVASLSLALLALVIMEWLSKVMSSKPFFSASFSEGNQMSTLEVKSGASLAVLHKSTYLLSEMQNSEGFQYILAAPNFQNLSALSDEISGVPEILSKRLSR